MMKKNLIRQLGVLAITGILWSIQSISAEEAIINQEELSQLIEVSSESVSVLDETLPEERRSFQVDNEEYFNQSNDVEVQPSVINEGIVLEGKNAVLYQAGVKQYDTLYMNGDVKYYFDDSGSMSHNKWAYSVKAQSWYYSDEYGEVIKEANAVRYIDHGQQLHDIVVNINDTRYYYEPQFWGGVLASNKWAYGVKDAMWYYADETGRIRKEANHTSYKEDGVQQSDTVLNINGVRYYYEPQYWGSVLARNKWAYGVKDATWYYADATGRIRKEANYTSYKEDGVQQSDIVLNINGVRYYYEPQYWGSVLARNKWAYGVKDATWYYADAIGRIRKEANYTSYKEDGVQQSDTVLNINGVRYYYEPQYWGSVLARNKWAYGVKDATWYYADAIGRIRKEANLTSYKEDGVQRYDALVKINDREYYYEPSAWNGIQAREKWAYSPMLKTWIKANSHGHANIQMPTVNDWIELAYSSMSDPKYWPSTSEGIRHLKQLNVPLLLQTDPAWGNSRYGNDASKSIWENGCAIVSLAMVDSYFKQRIVDPTEIANWAGLRHYVYGAGTAWTAFGDFANTYGYRMVNHGRNFISAMNAVQNGSVGIVSVKAGKYTTGGHLMVIRGYDNNQVLINDPNDKEYKQHSIKPQTSYEIQRDALNYWTFKKY